MRKSIKIWRGRLEITKYGKDYVINDKQGDLIIHADKLNTGHYAPNWLWLMSNNDIHIGSIWISTDTDIRRVKKFLEETK